MKLIFCAVALFVVAQAGTIKDKSVFRKSIPLRVTVPTFSKGAVSRITGGTEAPKHAFPYQVALHTERESGTYLCGGSFITHNYILTAAHCTSRAIKVTIQLGAHLIWEEEPEQVVFEVGPEAIYIHEKYKGVSNDISVIRLPEPVKENSYIRLIKLATDDTQKWVDESAIVSGWGMYEDGNWNSSEFLRWIWTRIITNKECSEKFIKVPDSNICADGSDGRSSCQGDSGGPLTVFTEDNTRLQVGIVSFGSGDGCEKGIPHVYVRVSSYIDWIREHTDLAY